MTIARRLYAVLAIMVLLISAELSALWFTIHTLSSVRAYVAGEGLWSKAEKDAAYHLEAYARTRDRREYAQYRQMLRIWAGDHEANLGLATTPPDLDRITRGFTAGGNDPADIPGMIALFQRFNTVSFIAQAIGYWTDGDRTMVRFQKLGTQLNHEIEAKAPQRTIDRTMAQIAAVNVKLTVIEDGFSDSLGRGSRWLTDLVLKLLLGAALLVELTGLLLTAGITRGISLRLKAMLVAAGRVSRGDFGVRLDQRKDDEIGRLATAFNAMTVDLESERERALDAIAAREATLREAQRLSNIGVWEWTFANASLVWSREVWRLHGVVSEGGVLSFATFMALVHSDDAVRVDEAFRFSRATGTPLGVDYRIAGPNGAERWLSAEGTVEFDAAGTAVRMYGTTRDVSERKGHEQSVERLNEELEHRFAELETFSYSVAHDLRAPLRAVAGFASALEEDFSPELNDEAQRYIGLISGNARQMGRLIDALLALARVSRRELATQRVDLSECAREIVAELRLRDPDRDAIVTIANGLTVTGDRELLRSALGNLIGNAWKFTRDCAPAVITFGLQADGDREVYAVRDNGVGFSEAYAEKLFLPFQRLHDDFEGTGVGLATVARIVQRHGGRVWANAVPDRGATFYFTLGRQAKPMEPEPAAPLESDAAALV